jgi:murein DD-endopeptidase MepM/ murein hydrolase activator NlpD
MDHASTERAFHVTMGQTPVTGMVRWAEGDTVLVLDPSLPLPYRARVTLAVALGARSAEGAPLRVARSVTFTVQPRSTPAVQPTRSPSRRPAPSSTAWHWPLIGPITQKFGETKTQYGFHQGIDIDGDTGDRVRAARGGRVVVAGTFDSCGGLQVHIDHGDGIESWYRHLSRIDVKRGDVVAAGAVIGRVGDTGCSLGSHLHFGIRLGTTFVDPLRYLPPR